jgi:hypothetical protein
MNRDGLAPYDMLENNPEKKDKGLVSGKVGVVERKFGVFTADSSSELEKKLNSLRFNGWGIEFILPGPFGYTIVALPMRG